MINRMKPLLSCLNYLEQGVFVAVRSISNNVLIFQEFMYDLMRAPTYRSLMAIKLDMKRVYDRLHWKFLERALVDFGFHGRWIALILACILQPFFAILINGTPFKSFMSSIGLHQRCHLSSYLFILYAGFVASVKGGDTRFWSSTLYPCP